MPGPYSATSRRSISLRVSPAAIRRLMKRSTCRAAGELDIASVSPAHTGHMTLSSNSESLGCRSLPSAGAASASAAAAPAAAAAARFTSARSPA